MKPMRNLQAIVTGIVVGSLFLGGLVELQDSGIGAGLFLGGYMQRWVPVVLVCQVAGAVGVIWLGWYWLKLAGGITSIARMLKRKQPAHIKPGGNSAINELSEAINERFDSYSDYVAKL